MPKVRKIFSMIVGGERDSINLKDSIMYADLMNCEHCVMSVELLLNLSQIFKMCSATGELCFD